MSPVRSLRGEEGSSSQEDRGAPSRGGRPTVLYVMGLWRSGSTILDIVLGNHDRVVSVGELRNLPEVGWGGDASCACGQLVMKCEFWSGVRAEWARRVGRPPDEAADRLRELQERYERLRSFPRLLGQRLHRSPGFREYTLLIGALFRALAERSGRQVIIDSTKYPARALALLAIRDLDVRLIHLVRDGRAVVWSCRRKPNTDLEGRPLQLDPEGVASRTTRQWLRVNLACEAVLRLGRPRALRLRYEDFVSRPTEQLRRIGDLSGLDVSHLASAVEGGTALEIGHMVAGNRVRLEGAVRLRPDLEWRGKLDDSDRRTFWRTAGWLARRYGYRA